MAGQSTQQFFEVLSSVTSISASASNSISLSDVAERSDKVGSTLLLTQAVAVDLVITVPVSNTLALTDQADKSGTANKSASNTFAPSDSVTFQRVLPTKTASSSQRRSSPSLPTWHRSTTPTSTRPSTPSVQRSVASPSPSVSTASFSTPRRSKTGRSLKASSRRPRKR